MHTNEYNTEFDTIRIQKRIKWAVMNGVNTCIITGTGEALQNTKFLERLTDIFRMMHYPFPNTELQTTGVMLNEETYSLLRTLGVNTISLSISDLFNEDNNANIIGIPLKLRFNLSQLCNDIKINGFNLRLSLNMTNVYDNIEPINLFVALSMLKADQITFRKLWHSGDKRLEQTSWVEDNACKETTIEKIREYVVGNNSEGGHGKELYKLPFGAIAYSLMKMSVVMDDDCMSKEENEKLKYVILRENGKLYCQWDDEGSLIF